MIAQSTIDRVKALPIADVVKPYVQLRKQGSSLTCCCPFHSERSPSFHINPGKNTFKCFGCDVHGDAIEFISRIESLDYVSTIEFMARQHGIAIEYVRTEKSEEQLLAARRKESLLNAMRLCQEFFVAQMSDTASAESAAARAYAFGRWPQDFCEKTGIGYAPADSRKFLDWCASKGLDIKTLTEVGMVGVGESGRPYAFFRNRVTIPIRSRTNQIIGFTARALGDAKAKYLNTENTELFVKSESVFGIDRVGQCGKSDYIIIVEGAPDVLRLQSIGLKNAAATLGTAWSEAQLEQLKRFTTSLCFVPDSDPPKGNEPLGPGFVAALKNGLTAMKMGFDVTVRELPFNQEPIYEDIQAEALDSDCPKPKIVGYNLLKNDADEHIRTKEDFLALEEKPFVVWMAEKRFASATSLVARRSLISEIADLLRRIDDRIVYDQCVESLAKIHGNAKLWHSAVDRAKGEARQKADKALAEVKSDRERDRELLRRFNLSISDNCYFTYDDEGEPTRLSNFILEPLYHIMDESNGTRLFKMLNSFGDCRNIELREAELCSLQAFQQRVGSLGNFVWRAKIDKLNNVKEYTYARTSSAERIRKMGWDAKNEFFAFGNGILVDGRFLPVDDLGIVRSERCGTFYLPATSSMYRHNPELFQFERLLVHENRSGLRLPDFVAKLIGVFGEYARVAFCYLLATLFRDIVMARCNHFPILNLFGEKGTGKTTLATCLQSLFIHGVDPPNLSMTSVPAMNERISQAVNTLTVFDEYKNDLDVRKIGFLKGLWGGVGQTKMRMSSVDGAAQQTFVTTGVALCGQDKPTQDMALFTRIVFLSFHKTSFSPQERQNYEDLVQLCNMGLTHLTVELLAHRKTFAENFPAAYNLTKKEVAARLGDEKVHDRIFDNWVIMLATFRALETALDVPFSYAELFDTAIKGLLNQNELAAESSEVSDFWNNLQGLQTAGRFVDKAHFTIKWHSRFTPIGATEAMEFVPARPVLYLHWSSVSNLLGRASGANATANRSNWSTMVSYLKSHGSFLGQKQQQFDQLLPNGMIDYTYETIGGKQTKKKKVNRPKALCFDYAALKAEFGIDFETQVITDGTDLDEDMMPPPEPPKPQQHVMGFEIDEPPF